MKFGCWASIRQSIVLPGRENRYFKTKINKSDRNFQFNVIFYSFKRQNNKTEYFMASPCLSKRLYIIKQQSYIDLKSTGVEKLGNQKHFSWQSTNVK